MWYFAGVKCYGICLIRRHNDSFEINPKSDLQNYEQLSTLVHIIAVQIFLNDYPIPAQCSGICITTHWMRTLVLLFRSLLENGTTPMENLVIASKSMCVLTIWLRISLLGIYPKNTLAKIHNDRCTRLFVIALLVIAKDWSNSDVINGGLVE